MRKIGVLSYIPFIIYLIFGLFLLIMNEKIDLLMWIISLMLLFLSSLGMQSGKKVLKLIGIIALSVFTIWYLVNGYFDYLQWTSSIVALIVLMYYVIINYFINKK